MERFLRKKLFQPKTLETLIENATIVIDTNVLLAGYQYRDITLNEIIEALKKLSSENRLKIPSHVLEEFFKNRPQRIVEMIQTVKQHRDKIEKIQFHDSINNKIPSLDYTKLDSDINKLEKELTQLKKTFNEKQKNYISKINELVEELKTFFNFDPILNQYRQFFEENYIKNDKLAEDKELEKQFQDRVNKKLPPGYKDGGKSENDFGDYKIWSEMLTLDDDVIFITADVKHDWVYKEPGTNKMISARRELVEEFYEFSGGKSFCLVEPSTFIQKFKPNVEQDIIEDLRVKDEGYFEKGEGYLPVLRRLNKQLSKQSGIPKEYSLNKEHSKRHYVYHKFLDEVIEFLTREGEEDLVEYVLIRANSIKFEDSFSEKNKNELYEEIAMNALDIHFNIE